MIKLFSKSLMSFEAKITGFISIVLVVLLLSPLYLGGLINLMRSSATGTVSDAFLNELLTESNPSVMLQRAKDAGLIVESLIGDTGEAYTIKDPATGQVVLTQVKDSISLDEVGDKLTQAFGANTAKADFVPQPSFGTSGAVATCKTGSGANVLVERGKIFGINSLLNVVKIKMPDGIDGQLSGRLNDALNSAVSSINTSLDSFNDTRDTSKVPRLQVNNSSATSNVDILFMPTTLPSALAEADYRKTDTGGVEHTYIRVNSSNASVTSLNSTELTNLMIHELAHALGLGHSNTSNNVMRGSMAGNEPALSLNSDQIEALIAAHDPSFALELYNCKVGFENGLKTSCGADVVLVRDLSDFEYQHTESPANPGGYPVISYMFDQASYDSFINLYKGLVDRLSSTSSRIAVVDPVSLSREEVFIQTRDQANNPIIVNALTPTLYHDQFVRLPFSDDFEWVKHILEARPDWPGSSVYKTEWSLGGDDQKAIFERVKPEKFQKLQSTFAALGSDRNSFPNLIIDIRPAFFSSWDFGYIYNYPYTDNFSNEFWRFLWPVDSKGNITGQSVSGGHFIFADEIPWPFGTSIWMPIDYRSSIIYTEDDATTLDNAVQKAISNFCTLPADPPTLDDVTIISDGLVSAESSNLFSLFTPNIAHAATTSGQYNINVVASDLGGSDKIARMNAIINRQGDNTGSYRGYFTWSKDPNPYAGGKDERSCTGGGYAALNPNTVYGPSYVTLDSCSVVNSGNTKTVTFRFHPNPSFTAPATNNLVSGSAENDLGSLGWKTNLVNAKFDLALTDTTPPMVSITSPTAGSTITGTKNVTANATDNVGVAGVQFKLDGVNLGLEDTTAPYSIGWQVSTTLIGNHTLTAVARDQAGNTTTSAPIMVVTDSILPKVSMTSPISGSTVVGTVSITATATDNVGVAGVQFMVDLLTPVGVEDTVSPYTASWNTSTATAGTHILTAVARDQAGNTKASSLISVVVVVPDTIPPAVSITSPKNNWIMPTIILTVIATASDNVGVVGVQFKLDGVNLGAEDKVSPYSVINTNVKSGYHTLTAVARDAAGNTKTSAPITIRKL